MLLELRLDKRRAAKPYQCKKCGENIEVGTYYAPVNVMASRIYENSRLCLPCGEMLLDLIFNELQQKEPT